MKDIDKNIINVLKCFTSSDYAKVAKYSDFYETIRHYTQNTSLIRYKKLNAMVNAYLNFNNKCDKTDFIKKHFDFFDGNILRLKPEFMKELRLNSVLNKQKLDKADIKIIKNFKFLFDNLYKITHKARPAKDGTYSFLDLSTGEQRILKFFADIYVVLKMKDVTVNTFIFDEMDLSWHPEWQRKMVHYILDIFKNVLNENDKRKINIIFTTHSPFILSDMPKENVVHVNKGKIQNNTQETFGANIHDLFNNSFFFNCKGGCTMGEFAKNKIKVIVEKLETDKKDLSQKELLELEDKINMVGEPIIRAALLKKLYFCSNYVPRSDNIEYLKAQNAKLQQEINKLTEHDNEKN